MRLEQLQYIVEVANQKSISKAAKNLYISQPSLSKAISLLESELGVTIFIRHQQGIVQTAAGESIIDKARTILSEIEDIKVAAKTETQLAENATLTVALPLLLCNDLINQTIHTIHAQYPALTILPYQSDTEDTITDLKKGTLDLGIISYSSYEKEALDAKLKDNHIFAQLLSKEDFCVVTGKCSSWGQRESISYKEIATFKNATFSEVFNGAYDPYLLPSNTVYLPNKESLHKALLEENLITIFPRIGAMTDFGVRSGELVAISLIDFPVNQYISLLFNADKAIPPHNLLFIKTFTDLYNAALQL